MFRGTFEHTIDDKGRVSIPSRFREYLQASDDSRVVLTNFTFETKPCLDVYPYAAWAELEKQLLTKSQFNTKILKFKTFYVSNAADCEIDRQGRILVPNGLREFAGLKRDVVITAYINIFRIWDKENWQQVFGAVGREFTEQPELLEDLGI
jgi:MraZ protein